MFIAFVASAATIGILGKLAPQPKDSSSANARPVSFEELAQHNDRSDCWIAIEGTVYDVTKYIPLHPTPPAVIAEQCGKEATEAFNTKGYGSPHSPAAQAMLPQYFVGELNEP
jgi:cytochrome b involved in lipid metabolism